ncbi:MAG: NAD(P)H-hydrate dehydratase [Zetaproteobacteria bacterium]|nr:MAG: NAD(P)H-hydrate dehydratase [Zetaproteobacteria bacterium]
MKPVHIVSSAQMRWADMQTMQKTPSRTLMERAGYAVAEAVVHNMPDVGRVVVVAGGGNNGGDGYAAAFFLRRRLPVTVVSLVPVERHTEDARHWRDQAVAAGVKVRDACGDPRALLDRWCQRAVIIVDALFGTGLKRPLMGEMALAVERINASDRPVLSIDMPSGIDADTGLRQGMAVRADWTLPIAACKWGHWLGDGPEHAGCLLSAADIGIAPETILAAYRACPDGVRNAEVVGEEHLAMAWPERAHRAHKGDFGHLTILGGSTGYAGAPQLAALGALAGGVGLVSIVCPTSVWPVIAAGIREAMVHPQNEASLQLARRSDACVAGPGWGLKEDVPLASLLQWDLPLVLDADALNRVARSRELQQLLAQRGGWTVLTPHAGEAARLLDCTPAEIERERRERALRLADRFGCWVVLKGAETLVVSPEGRMLLSHHGSPNLATGGTGDVLAGLVGMQLAYAKRRRIGDPMHCVAAAVALHGLAGEKEGWHTSSSLTETIARIRQRLERGVPWTLLCSDDRKANKGRKT